VLFFSLAMWPLGALLRSADRAASGASPALQRLRRFQRLAVAVDAVYLLAWFVLIQPVLKTEIGIYNYSNDAIVGALEISGLLAVAAAGVGAWVAWRLNSDRGIGATRATRIWSVLVALALLGVVWIGVVGKLMSWNLNY